MEQPVLGVVKAPEVEVVAQVVATELVLLVLLSVEPVALMGEVAVVTVVVEVRLEQALTVKLVLVAPVPYVLYGLG
jgi:hypothetical protein